jgi:2-oxoglutarate dehydrogenase E1 component
MATKADTLSAAAPAGVQQEREAIFDIFRRWGYLQASLDPLGQYLPPEPFPITNVPEGDIAAQARAYYCGNFAVEFMHIPSLEQRQWLQEQIEQPTPKPDQAHVLTQLIRADLFEQVIQQRYLGTKRFSLEGLTVLIPFLDQVFATASTSGVTRSIIAMAHRGRLNVMTNTIGRSPADIFARFEDVDPRSVLGGGDVKYHTGATGEYTSPDGKKIALHLASNPSHLEAVNPVVMGRARAWQIRMGEEGKQRVLPIILHGDAAFAGQGITAESLNMASLAAYNIGGTMHIITNNLLGFTATPEESNSTRFATDLAKRLPIPIFHVNGEDPNTAMRIAAIASEYRQRFRSDVVVDLIGYRRYGHNEADDPTVTQPRRYAAIKGRPFLYQLYAKSIDVDPAAEAKTIQDKFLDDQTAATQAKHKPKLSKLPDYWKPYHGGDLTEADEKITTGIPADRVLELSRLCNNYPAGFHIHPKVQKLYEQRVEMGEDKRLFDYGAAELLAYASLLTEGTPIRLAGQDSQRGTFNQRHSVLVDTETEVRYTPLDHMTETQARFEVHNSLLSESAALGFEYGYARDYPEALVLWEAQFGDFVNGAQSIIDQFIAAGEAKWGLLSGVVMLLPHGYDGQGPEHSSARMERFLQLAASDNMVIAQPSNASQYFHLLRRQALRSWRKPLVIFTPKSMLRHPDASAPVAEFGKPAFENVLPDNDVKNPRRLLVCTGKIGHNLRVERAKRKDFSVGIIFIEQLYPWPEAELQAALDQHPEAQEIIWVQEEPANMGAFSYVMPELRRMAGDRTVLSVKRSANASPATGSAKAHEIEEKTLINLALG